MVHGNAIAIIDIQEVVITKLTGLGLKDYNIHGNGLDSSDMDGVNLTKEIAKK